MHKTSQTRKFCVGRSRDLGFQTSQFEKDLQTAKKGTTRESVARGVVFKDDTASTQRAIRQDIKIRHSSEIARQKILPQHYVVNVVHCQIDKPSPKNEGSPLMALEVGRSTAGRIAARCAAKLAAEFADTPLVAGRALYAHTARQVHSRRGLAEERAARW